MTNAAATERLVALADRIELWPVDRLRPYERNPRTHLTELDTNYLVKAPQRLTLPLSRPRHKVSGRPRSGPA